jgi:hypothetical protein
MFCRVLVINFIPSMSQMGNGEWPHQPDQGNEKGLEATPRRELLDASLLNQVVQA